MLTVIFRELNERVLLRVQYVAPLTKSAVFYHSVILVFDKILYRYEAVLRYLNIIFYRVILQFLQITAGYINGEVPDII